MSKNTNSNGWRAVTNSPIFAIHPNREKPAEELLKRQNFSNKWIQKWVSQFLVLGVFEWLLFITLFNTFVPHVQLIKAIAYAGFG